MSPFTVVVGAFLVGLAAMSFAFGGGAVVVALPVAALGIVVLGVFELRRRRKQAESLEEFRGEAKAEKVEFTERDKETLASE